MSTESGGITEYIQHHLTFWSTPVHVGGFSDSVHADTLIVSVILGALFLFWFWWYARKATSGVPSKGQAFVELAIEFVDGQVKDSFHGDRRFIAPLALTVGGWVLFMSLMDLLPVDAIPSLVEATGPAHFRPVPTADPYTTFAMSLTVFALIIFYSFKAKGLGYFKELLTVPFGIWLFPFNVLLNLIELIAKPISLAMRLFGNIYAGELVFMLVAGLFSSWIFFPLGVIGYAVWNIFEILIILIQAFIFMFLTVVYISMAQDSH
ncbi:MAG TPA: F0F1 ATP synthase subunit A [Rhodanobacteraceae bacterium]|nr:F0F1 ATP synthase subunit A [Rhodanobacteraceae bacterium]